MLGDHALERAERQRLRQPVAQAADQVVARREPEPERRCVARGQRHRRDDRERPRKPGALGRGRRTPGALIDEHDVGLLGLDRLLQIAKL